MYHFWLLFFCFITSHHCDNYVRNDELSPTMSWVGCLLTDLVLSDKYMKVKIMEIKEILRRIGLFSENKTKSSESFCKQPTQLIIVAHNCQTSKRISSVFFFSFIFLSFHLSVAYILLFCLHLSVHGKIKKNNNLQNC